MKKADQELPVKRKYTKRATKKKISKKAKPVQVVEQYKSAEYWRQRYFALAEIYMTLTIEHYGTNK